MKSSSVINTIKTNVNTQNINNAVNTGLNFINDKLNNGSSLLVSNLSNVGNEILNETKNMGNVLLKDIGCVLSSVGKPMQPTQQPLRTSNVNYNNILLLGGGVVLLGLFLRRWQFYT